MRILGVDPGSRLTGFGCIDVVGSELKHVTHGTLHLTASGGRTHAAFEDRLLAIYEGLSEVIRKFKPLVISVEKVFFAKNAVSALKLGQARGVVVLTGKIHGLDIVEYSPNEVKLAIVGQGHADKTQVAKMVRLLTGCPEFETADASDGLALAICHAYSSRLGGSEQTKALKSASRHRTSNRLSIAESLGLNAIRERK